MGKLVEHLMRCAVCGAVPKIKDTYEIDPSEGHDYKLVCSQCSVHNGCGNWFKNKYKACQDWNRRQTKAPKVTAHLAAIAWIDVNEVTPPSYRLLLLTVMDCRSKKSYTTSGFLTACEGWRIKLGSQPFEVLYWAALPKPYKQKKNTNLGEQP